jgi:hypothetical protein
MTLSGAGRVALLSSVVQGLTMALASGTVIGGGGAAARAGSDQAWICFWLLSALEREILRGLARSATGIRRVRTPAS